MYFKPMFFLKKDNKFLYAIICAMILNVDASKMHCMLLVFHISLALREKEII